VWSHSPSASAVNLGKLYSRSTGRKRLCLYAATRLQRHGTAAEQPVRAAGRMRVGANLGRRGWACTEQLSIPRPRCQPSKCSYHCLHPPRFPLATFPGVCTLLCLNAYVSPCHITAPQLRRQVASNCAAVPSAAARCEPPCIPKPHRAALVPTPRTPPATPRSRPARQLALPCGPCTARSHQSAMWANTRSAR
jgi:hypothetical protein